MTFPFIFGRMARGFTVRGNLSSLVGLVGLVVGGFVSLAPAWSQSNLGTVRPVQNVSLTPGIAVSAPSDALAFALVAPTAEYVHGVFGQKYEFGALFGPMGEPLYAPTDTVLEERLIRVHDLDANGEPELLVVEANGRVGANLVLIELTSFSVENGWQVASISKGPAIGIGHRWMNPLHGQVDVTNDGVAEFAAMTTPHIGGPVVIYTWDQPRNRLVHISRTAVPGASNHRYGDPEQAWSTFGRDDDGQVYFDLRSRQDWQQIVRFHPDLAGQ